MSRRSSLDRAVVTLGAVSVLSAAFVVMRGDFEFVQVRGWGVAVAVVVGGFAVVAGWTARPTLAMVAGGAFLIAAVGQIVGEAVSENWFSGDGSTAALWLGLGAGLLTLAIAPRLWPGVADGSDR
jgi:hypothetical protein